MRTEREGEEGGENSVFSVSLAHDSTLNNEGTSEQTNPRELFLRIRANYCFANGGRTCVSAWPRFVGAVASNRRN